MFIVTGFNFLRQIFLIVSVCCYYYCIYKALIFLLHANADCNMHLYKWTSLKRNVTWRALWGGMLPNHLRDHLQTLNGGEGKESKVSDLTAGDQGLLSFKPTPTYKRIFESMIDHRSYTLNLSSWEIKAWKKKFRPEWDSNPWPLRYRCSALPTELSSQPGAGHFVSS